MIPGQIWLDFATYEEDGFRYGNVLAKRLNNKQPLSLDLESDAMNHIYCMCKFFIFIYLLFFWLYILGCSLIKYESCSGKQIQMSS